MGLVVFVAALQDIEHGMEIPADKTLRALLQRKAAVHHIIGAFGRAAEQLLQRRALGPVRIDFPHVFPFCQLGDGKRSARSSDEMLKHAVG